MLPLVRSDNNDTKTPRKTLSKTPSTLKAAQNNIKKQPIMTSVNRFNSFNTPSAKKAVVNPVRHTFVPKTTTMNMSYMPKESIDNNTFSIMNASTSTVIDKSPTSTNFNLTSQSNLTHMQPSLNVPSYSPLMRQIEATIERKLTSFMDSFRQTTIAADNGENDAATAVENGIREIRQSINAECSSLVRFFA